LEVVFEISRGYLLVLRCSSNLGRVPIKHIEY
jgi:hypothetical protein